MNPPVTLEQAEVGKPFRVVRIDDPETAMLAMRIGVSEGELLHLACRIPGGPVVVRRGTVEIAMGRELCRGISVQAAAQASDGKLA